MEPKRITPMDRLLKAKTITPIVITENINEVSLTPTCSQGKRSDLRAVTTL